MEDGTKGNVNETAGKAQSGLGKVIGDDEMVARGDVKQAEGSLQKMMGDFKDKAGELAEDISKPFKENDDSAR